MVICDILLILQYQVSTTVMVLVVVFALFVFMLALLCSCVAPHFRWTKIYTTILIRAYCRHAYYDTGCERSRREKTPRKFAETTRQWITRLVVITVKCMELNEMWPTGQNWLDIFNRNGKLSSHNADQLSSFSFRRRSVIFYCVFNLKIFCDSSYHH